MGAGLRVADVIRCCWHDYNRKHAIAPHAARAVRHILRCRTAALGGHMHRCDQCGSELPVYNSCQTRNCPSCQGAAREQWLDSRLEEVLPVQYFHVVFTLPHLLNALIDANRRLLLGEAFSTVNWVLQSFAHDPRWRLKGQIGFLALLHTWTQRLRLHFHIHCIVPGGVWREAAKSRLRDVDGREAAGQWVPCRGKWLFRKEALADAFRNRFIKRLSALRKRGRLAYAGRAAPLADDAAWDALLDALRKDRWVVFPKPTPPDPSRALEYVARYTHRIAISDHRIKALDDRQVTYSWRDRSANRNATGDEDYSVERLETIPAELFTRRFIAHILPDRFHKIRYYGWMAGAKRKKILEGIRRCLDAAAPPQAEKPSLAERILQRTGIDITLCPQCGKGHLLRTDDAIVPQHCRSP